MVLLNVAMVRPSDATSEVDWVICSNVRRSMRSAIAPPRRREQQQRNRVRQTDQADLRGGVGQQQHLPQIGRYRAARADVGRPCPASTRRKPRSCRTAGTGSFKAET